MAALILVNVMVAVQKWAGKAAIQRHLLYSCIPVNTKMEICSTLRLALDCHRLQVETYLSPSVPRQSTAGQVPWLGDHVAAWK
jgi:hypothetical protein